MDRGNARFRPRLKARWVTDHLLDLDPPYSTAAGFNNPSVYCADLERTIRHIHTSIRQLAQEVGAETEPASD